MQYNVTLAKTITFEITVEADSEDAALEDAYNQAPTFCAQCHGWGQKWGVNSDAEWESLEDFHGHRYDVEAHGKTVYLAA